MWDMMSTGLLFLLPSSMLISLALIVLILRLRLRLILRLRFRLIVPFFTVIFPTAVTPTPKPTQRK